MAAGDNTDFLARLTALLPPAWFAPGGSPVLAALLAGPAAIGTWAYGLIAYVSAQARLATATGGWLDLFAFDYFGRSCVRPAGQSDAAFAALLQPRLVRPTGTRAGLVAGVLSLTGTVPAIVEPWRCADCGAWGGGGTRIGYGVAGAWGSMKLPNQLFITAYRPTAGGVPFVAGYGTTPGGYGVGGIEWITAAGAAPGSVTDAQIYAQVSALMPAGTVAWTMITNRPPLTVATFTLDADRLG